MKFDTENRLIYECEQCQRSNCKLWRMTHTFLEHNKLYCFVCVTIGSDLNYQDITSEGKILYPNSICYTDQINGKVPAVPTADYQYFWGYTDVPPEGVKWWKGLSLEGEMVSSENK